MAESTENEGAITAQFRTIDPDYAGQRIDNYLLRELKGVPKTRIYRALRKGEVRVNKGRVKADYRLKAGDIVRIPPIRQASPAASPTVPRYWSEMIEQGILYEDRGLLVLNKPSGLAVHGGSGLNFGMIESLRQMRPDDRYLELVHRLDRDTSGLLIVAKNDQAHRRLSRALSDRRIERKYAALVWGHIDGRIDIRAIFGRKSILRIPDIQRCRLKFDVGNRVRIQIDGRLHWSCYSPVLP